MQCAIFDTTCTAEQHALGQRPSMHVDVLAVCRLDTMLLSYRLMQPLHSKQVVPLHIVSTQDRP